MVALQSAQGFAFLGDLTTFSKDLLLDVNSRVTMKNFEVFFLAKLKPRSPLSSKNINDIASSFYTELLAEIVGSQG